MNENGQSAENLLEEISNCRVADIGLEGFVECLDVGPKSCPYALPFGYAFLCRHPRLGDILKNTRETRQKQKAGA